jgi:hypothetical protein
VKIEPRQTTSSLVLSAVLCSLPLSTGAVGRVQQGDRAEAILARYVEAVGGKPNIQRIHNRVTQSSMSLGMGITAKLETVQQLPDRFVERGRASGWGWVGDFSRGFDGEIAWSREPDHGLRRIEGTLLQQFTLNYRLDRDARLDEFYPTRETLPDVAINAGPQHVLKLSTTFGTTEIWYFDSASGLLTRTEVIEDRGSKEGAVKITTTMEDYRDVDGVRLPFRKVILNGKRKQTITVTSISNNTPVAETFAPGR